MHTLPENPERRPALPPAVETAILEALQGLEFGSLEITIHDSRVVQVECKKKIRFSAGSRES